MTHELSRGERLERWATVLESCGKTRLTPLIGIEFLSRRDRLALRCPHSPVAVACQDPVLRRAGLAGDRLGDAMLFFGLSERQAHALLCSCRYLGMMRTSEVAKRLRLIAGGARTPARWPQKLAAALARWLVRLAARQRGAADLAAAAT